MNERYELYKAVRWEVEHFHEDCGFSMVDMWAVVNNRSPYDGYWWKHQCLDDYRAGRK